MDGMKYNYDTSLLIGETEHCIHCGGDNNNIFGHVKKGDLVILACLCNKCYDSELSAPIDDHCCYGEWKEEMGLHRYGVNSKDCLDLIKKYHNIMPTPESIAILTRAGMDLNSR